MQPPRVNEKGLYAGEKERAQKTAKANIQFVMANLHLLKRPQDINAANDFSKQTEPYTPGQMSYIEGLYEKVMKGAGFESCSVKHDLKRKFV